MIPHLFETEPKGRANPVVFRDNLFLYRKDDILPFACRASLPAGERALAQGEILYAHNGFCISRADDAIICEYDGVPRIAALFEPTDPGYDSDILAERMIDMLGSASGLDPFMQSAYSSRGFYEDYIRKTSELCGVLTDIVPPDGAYADIPFSEEMSGNSAYLAILLPIVSLMYRRISAMRGYNFRVSYQAGPACLAFSAYVLRSETESIPELDVIFEFEARGRLAAYSRQKEVKDRRDLLRLSLAICPQTCDPSDILRAPALLKRSKEIIKGIDIDVPGKY